jgi:hypothetical protein
MGKPIIDAKQALDFIRSGLDDNALMKRYKLSARGLQSLFRKLIESGAITRDELDERSSTFVARAFREDENEAPDRAESVVETTEKPHPPSDPAKDVREVVKDIRTGMGDDELMDKYRLTSGGLQRLFDHLLKVRMIRESDLEERNAYFDSTVNLLDFMQNLGLDRKPAAMEPTKTVEKCPACGAAQTIRFEECSECGVNMQQYLKRQEIQKKSAHARYKCPACKRPWDKMFEECPICGIVVSKLSKTQKTDSEPSV